MIRELLLGRRGELDPRGLRVEGVRVIGQVDLDHVAAVTRLALVGCAMPEGITCRHPVHVGVPDDHPSANDSTNRGGPTSWQWNATISSMDMPAETDTRRPDRAPELREYVRLVVETAADRDLRPVRRRRRPRQRHRPLQPHHPRAPHHPRRPGRRASDPLRLFDIRATKVDGLREDAAMIKDVACKRETGYLNVAYATALRRPDTTVVRRSQRGRGLVRLFDRRRTEARDVLGASG